MAKTKYKGVYLDETHGTYYVNTTFTTDDGHKIKKCKRGFATAKKANDWKLQYTVESKDSTVINKKGNLDSILINYIEYKKASLKPTALNLYKKILETHFIPNMPKDVSQIRVINILELHEYLTDLKIANSTKNMYITVFKNFVKWLELAEYISYTLANKFKVIFVKFKTISESKHSFITLEQFSKFIKTFNEEEEMFILLFNILFFTGARIGEALALRFEDVNFEKEYITFDKQVLEVSNIVSSEIQPINKYKFITPYTKTNSIKYVTIPEWLLCDIRSWEEKCNNEFMFVRKDIIITRGRVRKKLVEHLTIAELPIIKIHDLRHSHTTMLYESGCDSKYVAERLGHSTELTSINTYKHLTKQRKETNDNIIKSFKA